MCDRPRDANVQVWVVARILESPRKEAPPIRGGVQRIRILSPPQVPNPFGYFTSQGLGIAPAGSACQASRVPLWRQEYIL